MIESLIPLPPLTVAMTAATCYAVGAAVSAAVVSRSDGFTAGFHIHSFDIQSPTSNC